MSSLQTWGSEALVSEGSYQGQRMTGKVQRGLRPNPLRLVSDSAPSVSTTPIPAFG